MTGVPNGSITGAAGAYLVAGELSQRGFIASPTWHNAPRTDILAQSLDLPILAAIQVKTRTAGEFQLGLGGEKPALPQLERVVRAREPQCCRGTPRLLCRAA